MEFVQPKNLIRFLSNLELNRDVTTPKMPFSKGKTMYESKYYIPAFQVSTYAQQLRDTLVEGSDFSYASSSYKSYIVDLIDNENIEYTRPELYKLLQACVLETFSLIMIVELTPEGSRMFTKRDADRLHSNISYAISALEDMDKTKKTVSSDLIQALRDMDIDSSHLYKTISGMTGGGSRDSNV